MSTALNPQQQSFFWQGLVVNIKTMECWTLSGTYTSHSLPTRLRDHGKVAERLKEPEVKENS